MTIKINHNRNIALERLVINYWGKGIFLFTFLRKKSISFFWGSSKYKRKGVTLTLHGIHCVHMNIRKDEIHFYIYIFYNRSTHYFRVFSVKFAKYAAKICY